MNDVTYFLWGMVFNHWKKIIIGMILLMLTSEAFAGVFLDLDIGRHLREYAEYEVVRNSEGHVESIQRHPVSNDNPVGIVRVGYQTNRYDAFMGVRASFHTYYEHMSSASDTADSGIDVFMIGVRFE